MVGQQQLFVSRKGGAFDMQRPATPAPCQHCGVGLGGIGSNFAP